MTRGRVEGNHMTWNREDAGKDYLYRKERGRSEEEKIREMRERD